MAVQTERIVTRMSTVEAAFTSGVIENLTIEYILIGSVIVSGPDVKNVITKSSSDRVKASKPPAIRLGFKCGSQISL